MKPAREHTTNNGQTYFLTSETWERRALFRAESWARLFFTTLLSYRGNSYLLHEFVLMPDHFHILITPTIALERAVQLIKGGFSYRAKKEFGSNAEIWQRGFSDHRIRDFEDYDKHVHYIRLNPVKRHLCGAPCEYKYSSAFPGWKLDPIPRGLKPGSSFVASIGTAEAVPFQSPDVRQVVLEGRDPIPRGLKPGGSFVASGGTAKAVPFQSPDGRQVVLESRDPIPRGLKPGGSFVAPGGTAKAVPFQNVREGDQYVRHDDQDVRQGDQNVREGDQYVRHDEVCSAETLRIGK